jgi:hypothetical protein
MRPPSGPVASERPRASQRPASRRPAASQRADSSDVDEKSSSSRSARIRKAPAVAAFGAQAEQALKLRALGDAIEDIIKGLRHRDALALGTARKLLTDWRSIGEPLLFYPTEVRASGKLVIAAELERAAFIFPAYQAGLRALSLRPETTSDALLELCELLLRLEGGALSHEAFFDRLWTGSLHGLGVLLGHPLEHMAGTVLEHGVSRDELWASHTAAAMAEWNALAWSAGQSESAATLAQRFGRPLEALVRRIEHSELGLSREQLGKLQQLFEAPEPRLAGELELLLERPQLAEWLAAERASGFVTAALEQGARLSSLIACAEHMSPDAAAAAVVALPELAAHSPRLCSAVLQRDAKGMRDTPLARALWAEQGAGARRLADAALSARGEGFAPPLLAALLGALIDMGLGGELVLPAWSGDEACAELRVAALRALGRDAALLAAALELRPLAAHDPPEVLQIAASLRRGGT